MSQASHIIRVLIADQQSLFCRGARIALGSDSNIHVVGEACEVPSLLKLLGRLELNVLLVDLTLAKQSGIKEFFRNSSVRLIVLLNTLDRPQIIEALRLGATGMVLKTASPAQLRESIESAYIGKYAISSEAMEIMVAILRETPPGDFGVPSESYTLTARELEIIEKITAGLSNREVCEEFSISERTVKHHLTKIYNKVGVTNRLALALFAINNRLITSHTSEPNGFSNSAVPK